MVAVVTDKNVQYFQAISNDYYFYSIFTVSATFSKLLPVRLDSQVNF